MENIRGTADALMIRTAADVTVAEHNGNSIILARGNRTAELCDFFVGRSDDDRIVLMPKEPGRRSGSRAVKIDLAEPRAAVLEFCGMGVCEGSAASKTADLPAVSSMEISYSYSCREFTVVSADDVRTAPPETPAVKPGNAPTQGRSASVLPDPLASVRKELPGRLSELLGDIQLSLAFVEDLTRADDAELARIDRCTAAALTAFREMRTVTARFQHARQSLADSFRVTKGECI